MEYDIREGQFAAEFVGHRDNAHIGDIRVAQEVAFKFRRGNLEAADFDQLLQTRMVSVGDCSREEPYYLEAIDNIDVALSIVFDLITRTDPSTDLRLQRYQCQQSLHKAYPSSRNVSAVLSVKGYTISGGGQGVTYAFGFSQYPSALEGLLTTSSPRSPSFASVPSSLTTLNLTPGTATPALPALPTFSRAGVIETAVDVSVMPTRESG
jgi:hypothetical protein